MHSMDLQNIVGGWYFMNIYVHVYHASTKYGRWVVFYHDAWIQVLSCLGRAWWMMRSLWTVRTGQKMSHHNILALTQHRVS